MHRVKEKSELEIRQEKIMAGMPTPITDFLITHCGFKRVTGFHGEHNFFSCVIRLHEIHYLYYSEHLKHFSILVQHEKPRGQPGGGIQRSIDIMIPRVINSTDEAKKLVQGIIDY